MEKNIKRSISHSWANPTQTTTPPFPTRLTQSAQPLPELNNNNNANILTQSREEKYSIDFEKELQLQVILGHGAFGEVWKAKYHGTIVAVKKIINTHELDPKAVQDFVSEISVMSDMRPHSNICAFYGYSSEPLAIVMEYLPGGSMESYLARNPSIPIGKKLNWLKDIASGMYHLQITKIVHKDLAARNVLIARDLSAKVTDFGLSRLSKSESNTNSVVSETKVGPLKWMAPESLTQKKFSIKSDVWAFAVTSVEVLTQQPPYPNLDPVQVATGVCLRNVSLIPEIPRKDLPDQVFHLLSNCVEFDSNQRPDFQKIVDILDGVVTETSDDFIPPPTERQNSSDDVYAMTPSFVGLSVSDNKPAQQASNQPLPKRGVPQRGTLQAHSSHQLPRGTSSDAFRRGSSNDPIKTAYSHDQISRKTSGSSDHIPKQKRSGSAESLDDRWEVRTDSHGRPYYVDHVEKRTTYTPPEHLRPQQPSNTGPPPPQQHYATTSSGGTTTYYPPPMASHSAQSLPHYPAYYPPPMQPQYPSYYPPQPIGYPAYPPTPYYAPPTQVSPSMSNGSTSSTHSSEQKRQLPPNWEAKLDPQGRVYFVNHTTRQTTYEFPTH